MAGFLFDSIAGSAILNLMIKFIFTTTTFTTRLIAEEF